MSDADKEIQELEQFISTGNKEVDGVKLRPITAGTYLILKRVGNPIISGSEEDLEKDDMEYHLASFLYVHDENNDLKDIRKNALNAEAFTEAVFEYAETLTIIDFVKSTDAIREIVDQATIGSDVQVKEDPEDEKKTESTPVGQQA